MKVAIGCDHGGYELKEYLKENLSKEYEMIDEGCYSKDSVDYPVLAQKVGLDVKEGRAEYGIIICTNGVGVTMVANKVRGVRCALCLNESMAEHAKLHNDANMISFGQINQPMEDALKMAKVFLTTPFSNEERHARRVNIIKKIEGEF